MNDQNPRTNRLNGSEDTYDVLHRNFTLFGDSDFVIPEEDDVKNSGEIYFSANTVPSAEGPDLSDFDFSRFAPPSAGRQNESVARNGDVAFGRTQSSYASSYPKPSASASRSTATNRNAPASPRSAYVPATSKPAASTNAKPAANRTPVNNQPVKKTESAKKGSGTKKKKKKANRKGSFAKSLLLALVVLGFVVLASMVISEPIKSCMNDLIAIDRSSVQKMVVLDKDMTTDEVIDKLEDSGMIYSAVFCKFASHILHFDQSDPKEAIYPAGTYLLSYDMGIEGMLKEILNNGEVVSTVKVSFPEGFTVDQIVQRLEENKVASASALYDAMNSDELFDQYPFLQNMENRAERYRALEGFLYPDTYEFYIGENPQSVIKRFLDNFSAKWEDKYEAMLETSGRTMEEVIIVASICQKEANDGGQMRTVSSIIYNRLDSSSFPFINCDSTSMYITNRQEQLQEAGTFDLYLARYNTNERQGLPAGPICNPGDDALVAALRPESTSYYYFMHDLDGEMHVAETLSEHESNLARYPHN